MFSENSSTVLHEYHQLRLKEIKPKIKAACKKIQKATQIVEEAIESEDEFFEFEHEFRSKVCTIHMQVFKMLSQVYLHGKASPTVAKLFPHFLKTLPKTWKEHFENVTQQTFKKKKQTSKDEQSQEFTQSEEKYKDFTHLHSQIELLKKENESILQQNSELKTLYNSESSSKDLIIKQGQKEIVDLNVKVCEAKNTLSERDDEIKKLKEEIEELESQNLKLEQENVNIKGEIDILNHEANLSSKRASVQRDEFQEISIHMGYEGTIKQLNSQITELKNLVECKEKIVNQKEAIRRNFASKIQQLTNQVETLKEIKMEKESTLKSQEKDLEERDKDIAIKDVTISKLIEERDALLVLSSKKDTLILNLRKQEGNLLITEDSVTKRPLYYDNLFDYNKYFHDDLGFSKPDQLWYKTKFVPMSVEIMVWSLLKSDQRGMLSCCPVKGNTPYFATSMSMENWMSKVRLTFSKRKMLDCLSQMISKNQDTIQELLSEYVDDEYHKNILQYAVMVGPYKNSQEKFTSFGQVHLKRLNGYRYFESNKRLAILFYKNNIQKFSVIVQKAKHQIEFRAVILKGASKVPIITYKTDNNGELQLDSVISEEEKIVESSSEGSIFSKFFSF